MLKFQPNKTFRLESSGQVDGLLFLLGDITGAPSVWEEVEHGYSDHFSCRQLRNLYTLENLLRVFKCEIV